MITDQRRHAEPLTVEYVDLELERWAAAGFPIPNDTEDTQ